MAYLVNFHLPFPPESRRNDDTQRIVNNGDRNTEPPDDSQQCAPKDGSEHDDTRGGRILDWESMFADEFITSNVLEVLCMWSCREHAYTEDNREECIGGNGIIATCTRLRK